MRKNRADDMAQEMNTQKCTSIARLQCEEDQCPQKLHDDRYAAFSLRENNAVMQPLVS